MRKILLIVAPVALVALLFAAYTALANDGMRGSMHHHEGLGMSGEMMVFHLEHLAKDLNLTPDQQAKLDAIKQSLQQSMDQGMNTRDELHNTIQQQISSGTFDFGQIRPMLDAQIDARAAAAHQMIANLQDFYNGLTPDQKSKIASDMKSHMDMMQERKQRWEQKKSGATNNPNSSSNPQQN
jgi:Spy/CpxP family protein refolding chaperone